MANGRNRLQPFHVFKAEATAVNELYWRTRYSYARVAAVLDAIATTGQTVHDPRVTLLWPSTVAREQRHVTVPLGSFKGSLQQNLSTLRRTSVLYLCSAFENAISAYFVLGCLYRPKAIDSKWQHGGCPALAAQPAYLGKLLSNAKDAVGEDFKKRKVKGRYSARLRLLDKKFGLSLALNKIPTTELDSYYLMRHRIAHNQGLTNHHDPTVSPKEVLASGVNIDEPTWCAMAGQFMKTIESLDDAMRRIVVRDHSLTLLVAKEIELRTKDGHPTVLRDLRHSIATNWKMDITWKDVFEALRHLGRRTSAETAIGRRTVL